MQPAITLAGSSIGSPILEQALARAARTTGDDVEVELVKESRGEKLLPT